MAKDITIAVKAKLQTDASEIKKAIADLEDAMSGTLKDDTSLYKSVVKQLNKLKEKASDFTLIGEQNIISRADLSQAERLTRDIFKRMARLSEEYKGGAIKFFDIPKERIQEVERLEEAYKNIQTAQERTGSRKLKASLKNPNVNAQIFSGIYASSKKARLDIDETDTIGSYQGRISAEKTRVSERLKTLNANEGVDSIKAATVALANAAKALAEKEQKATEKQLNALAPGVKGYDNAATKKRIYDTYGTVANATFRSNADLQNFFRGMVFKSGTNDFLTQGTQTYGDQTALGLLKLLGADNTAEYQKIIDDSNKKNRNKEDINNQISTLFEQTISKLALKEFRSTVRPKAGNLVSTIQEGVSRDTEFQQAQTTYNTLETKVSTLETERNALTTLSENLNALSDRVTALEKTFLAEDTEAERAEKSALREQIVETKKEGKAEVMGDTDTPKGRAENVSAGIYQLKEEVIGADSAAKEAENFKNRLQAAVKQWMGAREIINYTKRGIREAYQDIRNLDKAMTNIAVVTDFSVEELWGQINDYMAIAKQYGVTTQGVYEVTQLFYQQGLGINDTMAATIETLKMARIAGVSYSDAADGMTVAIRAFNMEMEDAAHVTDVYSKVAA